VGKLGGGRWRRDEDDGDDRDIDLSMKTEVRTCDNLAISETKDLAVERMSLSAMCSRGGR